MSFWLRLYGWALRLYPPAFVSRSLVPHHLAYTGLALVSVWAVIDLSAALRSRRFTVAAQEAPDDERVRPAAVALVGLVAVGALAASWAVLAT